MTAENWERPEPEFEIEADGRGHVLRGRLVQQEGFLPLGFPQDFHGDYHFVGFYWPIGRESRDPIVCEVYYEPWDVFPIASTLPRALRLLYSTFHAPNAGTGGRVDPDEDDPLDLDVRSVARRLNVDLTDIQRIPVGDGGIPYWRVPSAFDLLPNDTESPHLLALAALELLEAGDLAACIEHARRALEILPEYGFASYLLADALRQRGERVAAIEAMLDVMISDARFGGDRATCLRWLREYGDHELPDCTDPIWKVRHQLTFVSGVKRNDDYLLYAEAIEEYHRQGRGDRAIRLRLLVADDMCAETVSFQERYGWSFKRHREQLLDDYRRAGCEERAIALSGP